MTPAPPQHKGAATVSDQPAKELSDDELLALREVDPADWVDVFPSDYPERLLATIQAEREKVRALEADMDTVVAISVQNVNECDEQRNRAEAAEKENADLKAMVRMLAPKASALPG